MKAAILIAILILSLALAGCGKSSTQEFPDAKRYTCPDGSLVTDMAMCPQIAKEPEPAIDNSVPAEPDIMEIEETETVVMTEEDARVAFNKYIDNNNLDYEILTIEADGEYYRIRYAHNERGGGKSSVLVDAYGNIKVELPLA